MRNRMVWLAAVVLAAGGIWYFGFARNGADKVTYEVQAIDRGNIETSVASSGSVTPLITVTVGSEVSGKLLDVLVDFNDKVKKGQLLAKIDSSTFEAKAQSANADLIVQKATVGSREVDLSNSQVVLEQAKRDYERTKVLFDKGLMSSSDMEKARNAQDQGQNAMKIAQANLNNARSQIVKMQAAVDQSKLDLGRTEIRAPVDGVVISRQVDPGQTVAATMQAPVLFLVAQDLSAIKIETKVDEADIGTIKQDARATFTVDAYPDRSFVGRVAQVRINGTSAQNVVTYSVMVQADNPNQALLPGMTANVRIITAERNNVLRVPAAALRFRPPGAGGVPPSAAGGQGGGAPAGPMAGGPGGQRGGQGARGGQRGGARALLQMSPELMKELGLSAEQQGRITAAMAELTQRTTQGNATGGASNPLGGGGAPNFRGMMGNNGGDAQLLRQRMMNLLGNILTPEQMQKYQAMSSATAERPGTVYVLAANGLPEARSVRVGLSSDSAAELLSGLEESDRVIVRARTGMK